MALLMSSVQSSSGSLKTRPRHSIVYSVEHTSASLTNDPRRVNTGNPYPHPRGASVSEGQLCMLSAAPTVRLQVRIGDLPPERHRTARIFRACPLSPQGSYWLTDITTPFSGNASASFQQNLNRLPTGGDRIPAPRLLSISRQLESRAERGYSNRRSRAGSPVQRYTGRRNPPRPAENRSGAREAAQPFGTGPISACRFAADIRIRPQR